MPVEYFVAIAPYKRGRTRRLHLTRGHPLVGYENKTVVQKRTLCGKYVEHRRPRLWLSLDMDAWDTKPEQRCPDCERHYASERDDHHHQS